MNQKNNLFIVLYYLKQNIAEKYSLEGLANARTRTDSTWLIFAPTLSQAERLSLSIPN